MPELAISDEKPEVSILFGKTPSELAEVKQKNQFAQAGTNHFLLFIPGIANYYVANGNSIIIEPAPQAEGRAIRLFLLGTVLGVLLMQRGILSIHGSAVSLNGKGVIFTGMSGAGKSTLLAAFCASNYSLLTDDIAAVTFDQKGKPVIHPGYPQQKLWRDSMEKIGLKIQNFSKVKADIDKYAVPIQHRFCPKSMPLAAVVEIKPGPYSMVSLSRLCGSEKLSILIKNTYRAECLAALRLQEKHFQQCVHTAGNVEVFRLCRPEGIISVDEQMHLVLEAVGK